MLALVLVLVACNNTTPETPEKPDTEDSETDDNETGTPDTGEEDTTDEGEEETPAGDVEITYLLLASGTDVDKIEEKINERLKELDATYTVNLVHYGWDNYTERLGLAARGTGDKFDIATTASWLGPYRTLVTDGGLMDITGLMEENMPNLYPTLAPEQIEGVKLDGKAYGVPTRFTAMMARDNFAWNMNMLEDLGFTFDDVKDLRTVESLEPMLKAFKDKYPNEYPLDSGSEWALRRVDSLIKTDENGDAVIENIFAADYMREALETIKKYADAGYIHPDAGSDLAPKQTDPETWLVMRAEGEPGAEALWSVGEKNTPIKSVLTAEDVFIGNANIQGKMTSVYAHSEHPAEALDFVDKIGTDEVIQNLLAWGIEGEHYNVVDGNVETTEAQGEGWAPWQAQLVSDAKRLPGPDVKAADDPELVEEVKAFEAELKPAADLGFTPSAELETKMGEIQAIKDTYYGDLARGRMETYDNFLSDLEAAGIDQLVTDLQAEYDAWKAQ